MRFRINKQQQVYWEAIEIAVTLKINHDKYD